MMRGRTLWLTILPLTLAVALAGWALTEPKSAPQPRPARVAPAATTLASREELCREYTLRAFAMADHLDQLFRQHANAHKAWRQHKIPFGPADKPGTVLWVWHRTLHDRQLHATHYHETRDAYRRVCLT